MSESGIRMVEGGAGVTGEREAWEKYWINIKEAHPKNPNIPSLDQLLLQVQPFVRSESCPTLYEHMMNECMRLEREWGIQTEEEEEQKLDMAA